MRQPAGTRGLEQVSILEQHPPRGARHHLQMTHRRHAAAGRNQRARLTPVALRKNPPNIFLSVLHTNLFWLSPYGEQYSSFIIIKQYSSLFYINEAVLFLFFLHLKTIKICLYENAFGDFPDPFFLRAHLRIFCSSNSRTHTPTRYLFKGKAQIKSWIFFVAVIPSARIQIMKTRQINVEEKPSWLLSSSFLPK